MGKKGRHLLGGAEHSKTKQGLGQQMFSQVSVPLIYDESLSNTCTVVTCVNPVRRSREAYSILPGKDSSSWDYQPERGVKWRDRVAGLSKVDQSKDRI